MVNEEIIILRKIKKALEDTNSFKFVGYYRNMEDHKIARGQRFPMLLIEDSDENITDTQQSLTVTKQVPINIWLYHNVKKNLTETMLGLQNVISDTLLDDSLLNTLNTALTGTMDLVQWYNTEKGTHLEDFDFRTTGFSDDKICWKLSFNFNFQTAR